MPVGVMLKSMTSGEITEWMAYFKIKNETMDPGVKQDNPENTNTGTVLKAMLAHRVKKKKR